MLLLELCDVLECDGAGFKFSREITPPAQNFRGETLEFTEPVVVTGNVKNMRGTVEIYASVIGKIRTKCARCGEDAFYTFAFDYTDDVKSSDNDEEGLELIGTAIDLESAVLKEILCNMPFTVLCREDCKGLCPKCGVNLNRVTCDCTSPESDAVWEKLKLLKFD